MLRCWAAQAVAERKGKTELGQRAGGSGSWAARLLRPKTEKGKEKKILIKLLFYFLKHIFKTNSNSL